MYFIQRCWFLKCSEEIHYVPIGAGDMWYYVPVDDGWEKVLGRNVYITSQYFSPNAKYWTASSGNRTRAPPDRMWTLYHWAMESVHNMGVLVIHYVPVLLSKCQILNFMSHFSGHFEGASLEMAHKVIVPQKKIMSRSFLNSGTLIVIQDQYLLVKDNLTDYCRKVCCDLAK